MYKYNYKVSIDTSITVEKMVLISNIPTFNKVTQNINDGTLSVASDFSLSNNYIADMIHHVCLIRTNDIMVISRVRVIVDFNIKSISNKITILENSINKNQNTMLDDADAIVSYLYSK